MTIHVPRLRELLVRLRTVMTLATGAATGAGVMYLFDPEHGPARRREARRTALRQARQGAVSAVIEGRKRAEDVAVAAINGYRQAREEGARAQVLDR